MTPRSFSSHIFKTGRAAFALRALRYRNYRLFFGGQIVSLVGSWMTTVATSWLVYRLTGSALLLGVVGFCTQLPTFFLAPFAGLVVDRQNRHTILVVTQTLSMVQSFLLAGLTLTNHITVSWLLALCVFQGLINAFDMPCRQAFVVHMIEKRQDLGNAIALNSTMFNAARLVGPAIGGILIAGVGEGGCFFVDGVSYCAVILALLAMTVKKHPAASGAVRTGVLSQLHEGWSYVARSYGIRTLMMFMALVCLLGVPYMVLMPVFAKSVLGGGPHTLGFLTAATGAGALLGALWLAGRENVQGLGKAIAGSAGLFGLGLVGFSLSRMLWLSIVMLVVASFGFMVQMAGSNTIVQTIVEDDKRGRVMSFYIMAFMGASPLGSLLAGSLSEAIGAPKTLLILGCCVAAGSGWFFSRLPKIRESIHSVHKIPGIPPPMIAGS